MSGAGLPAGRIVVVDALLVGVPVLEGHGAAAAGDGAKGHEDVLAVGAVGGVLAAASRSLCGGGCGDAGVPREGRGAAGREASGGEWAGSVESEGWGDGLRGTTVWASESDTPRTRAWPGQR